MADQSSSFEIGRVYHRRKELHDVYGGNRQSGIASCRDHPYVFLFSAPTGRDYGYKDGWISKNEYLYTGEGQFGDMELLRGNRAIKNHETNGKQLHVFEFHRAGEYTYVGEFMYSGHEYEHDIDGLGRERQTIRFHLVPLRT